MLKVKSVLPLISYLVLRTGILRSDFITVSRIGIFFEAKIKTLNFSQLSSRFRILDIYRKIEHR